LIFFLLQTASSRTDGVGYRLKEERISEAFDGDHGGTLVIADAKPQVLKACKGETTMFLPLLFWRKN
jgi:hypothetical protein